MSQEGGERVQKVLLVVSLIAVITMAIIDLTYDDRMKPDAEFPMANQHIEWTYAK